MLKLLKSPLRVPLSNEIDPAAVADYRACVIARARARAEWMLATRTGAAVPAEVEKVLAGSELGAFSDHPMERIAAAWPVAGVAEIAGVIAAPAMDPFIRGQLSRLGGHAHGMEVDLVCELASASYPHAGQLRSLIGAGGALEQLGLTEVTTRFDGTSFATATPRLLGLFEGLLVSDPRLASVVGWRACERTDSVGVLARQEMDDACESMKHVMQACTPPLALFVGPSGCGRTRVAGAVAAALGCERAAVVDAALLPRESADLSAQLRQIENDVRFLGGLLVIRAVDAAEPTKLRNLSALLSAITVPTIVTATTDEPLGDLDRMLGARLRLNRPPASLRREAWTLEAQTHGYALDDAALDQMAAGFALTRSAIARTVDLAVARDPGFSVSDLAQCAASQVRSQLERYAKRSLPTETLAQLVLATDVRDQLHEIVRAVKMRPTIDRLYGGRVLGPSGVAALFNGPPGTEKTLSANALANELEMPLYRIDVSSIVDRYVGETEKNLARVFEEAEGERGLLLFDEADSLFTKRVEVSDSHDRFANMQVNMLLNLIDDYSGLVVLTTNLKANIDTAFLRRMSFKITFELPDVNERFALWKHHLPPELPVVHGINLSDLARRYKSSGGEIRNAVYRAILLGEPGEPLDSDRLERALCLELEGAGNVVRRTSSLTD